MDVTPPRTRADASTWSRWVDELWSYRRGAGSPAAREWRLRTTVRSARFQLALAKAFFGDGMLAAAAEKLDDAVAAFRWALLERDRDEYRLGLAVSLNNRGIVRARAGRVHSARADFEEALAHFRRLPTSRRESRLAAAAHRNSERVTHAAVGSPGVMHDQ